jgi:cytochrome c-type biogenesis protein
MYESFLDGSNINLFVALVAGFVTFFASCLLPLVPTYLAYLSGVSLNSEDAGENRFHIIKTALFFVLGFIFTFVLLSLAFNVAGVYISSFRDIVEKIAGGIFIVLGLFMLGVFKHRIFTQERRLDLRSIFSKNKKFNINNFIKKHRNLHAILTGIAFGFAWTPCIGPVLAVILYWSSNAESAFSGMLLLIAYGIGLGIPFLIVAAGFETIIPQLKKYAKVSKYVSIVSGVVIILAGIMMITGNLNSVSLLFLKIFNLKALSA